MDQKVVHLMRHGTTEMNVYLAKNRHGRKNFTDIGSVTVTDPLLYDTRLTEKGKLGAEAAAAQVAGLNPPPELLVVSPLTRALQTVTLAFGHQPGCPVLVEPLWRERLYLSSDVGRHPEQLQEEFPHFSFDHLPDVWWHTETPHDPLAIHEEPNHVFVERMAQLQEWLLTRQEQCIAVVSHSGCLAALTGVVFHNCEIRTTHVSCLVGSNAR